MADEVGVRRPTRRRAGVDVYTVGRAFVSVSLGWARPVYVGADRAELVRTGHVQLVQLGADTFTFKVGLGI